MTEDEMDIYTTGHAPDYVYGHEDGGEVVQVWVVPQGLIVQRGLETPTLCVPYIK